MADALAARASVGIAMLDVDRFKHVNDTYGHTGGDQVLIEVGRRLEAVRSGDVVARWGGEEFCVLLTGITCEASLQSAAERLRQAVSAEPIVLDDGTLLDITASIGAGRSLCPTRPGAPRPRRRRRALRGEARWPQPGVPRAGGAGRDQGPQRLVARC